MSNPKENHANIVIFLKTIRDNMVTAFESLEPTCRFIRTPWKHHEGGGGEISLLRGHIFEKAAVNWSEVSGTSFPGNDATGPFYATGVSLITHMANPYAPTVHMNIRYIETSSEHWFGGGYDLTPMGFPQDEDTRHFHQTAQAALDPFNPTLYPLFSSNARSYFHIPHREKERGVGGIFFDHYNTHNFSQDFAMWQSVGNSLLHAIMPIYKKRIHHPFTETDRQQQLLFRGHYAEFNLLYDRGTKFGFLSKGNPNAILCSMPPPLW